MVRELLELVLWAEGAGDEVVGVMVKDSGEPAESKVMEVGLLGW